MSDSSTTHWPTFSQAFTGLRVGRCAWHGSMLLRGDGLEHVRHRPSLIVFDAEEDVTTLARAAEALATLDREKFPVMLGIVEPEFTRTLPALVQSRAAALGLSHVDVLCMKVQDTAELKAGGSLHALLQLRERGVIGNLGLAHEDVRQAEWLAINMATRVLCLPWELENQAADHRAIKAAEESGMTCVALRPTAISDERALRFALGRCERVLPVLREMLPANVSPMDEAELEVCWQEYATSHAPPAPLPRSRPPEE